jgi:exonuclease SbcC
MVVILLRQKKMIDKLILKNFQAHKESKLEFCPGVNAIIGESDEGKTSIIRALKWAARNQPSGGDFISDFSKKDECSSTIVIGDNEITRLKTKTKNEYWINDQSFKALGKGGVPKEVSDILQLDDLNFQNQMDAPFLLSDSGGEVARFLNKIVNLDIIDESLSKINIKVNNTNKSIEVQEAGIEEDQTELEALDWIDEAEKELKALDELNLQYLEKKEDQKNLIYILEIAEDLIEELEPYKDLENKLEIVELLIQKTRNWMFDNRESNEFLSLINEAQNLKEQINQYEDNDQEEYEIKLLINEYLSYEKGLELLDTFKEGINSVKTISNEIGRLTLNKKEIAGITSLSSRISLYQSEEEHLLEFDSLLDYISGDSTLINGYNISIKKLESEFKRYFPDTCPLCGDLR